MSVQHICPECHGKRVLARLIPHINDDHGWTREQIADWVATIEPQQAPQESEMGAELPEQQTAVIT
jgi:hypothetical protein